MSLISENEPQPKIDSPETVAEAHRGWQFGLGSLAIAWGAKLFLADATFLPNIVLAIVFFAPPLLAILGIVHTIGAFKNHFKINGLLIPAILGSVVAVAAVASMIYLFFF